MILRKEGKMVFIVAMLLVVFAVAMIFGGDEIQSNAVDRTHEELFSTQTLDQKFISVNIRINNPINFNFENFLDAVEEDFLLFVGNSGTGNRDLIATNLKIIQFDSSLRLFSAIISAENLLDNHRNQLLNNGILLITSAVRNYGGINIGTAGWRIYFMSIVLPTPPTPDGFTFCGWFFDSEFTQPFDGRPVTGDMELHAKFVPITYTISFSLGGGSFVSIAPSTFTVLSPDLTLTTATRRGYTFQGWYNNSAFTGSPTTQIVTGTIGDQRFYARWEVIVYTITYNLNGGILPSNAPTTFTVNSPTITLPVPTRDGYYFGGWFNNIALVGTPITEIVANSIDNRSFFALWNVVTYDIIFNLNGGFFESTPNTTFTIECPNITLPTPNRSGHYFRGWYRNSAFSGQAVTQIETGTFGNQQFFARWEIMRFTISFIVGGEVWQEIVVNYGTTLKQVTLLNIETGQMTEVFIDSFESKAFCLATAITSDIELFANSEFAIMNSITFNVRGQRTTHWIPHNERLNNLFTPEHFGYVFVAWYHNEAFTQRVSHLDRLTTNIELFARFEPLPSESDIAWWQNRLVWIIAGLILIILTGAVIAFVVIRKKKRGG